MESLLEQMIEQQAMTNQLLSLMNQNLRDLILALADDGSDQESATGTYMDGSPVR